MTSLIRHIYTLLILTLLINRDAFGAVIFTGGAALVAAPAATVALTSATAVGTSAAAAAGTGSAAVGAALGPATTLTLTSLTAFLSPVGLALGLAFFGAEHDNATIVSWDCWKPLLHDRSQEPSHGRPVHRVLADPRVKLMNITEGHLLVSNVWNEVFRVDFFGLTDGLLVAHATKLNF